MKRSQKLTSLLQQSYEEILFKMTSKLDEHFMSQPHPDDADVFDSYLDYLHVHIVKHRSLNDIPGLEEQVKKIILKQYKQLSKGERFAFLTYLAETDTYPDQKVLTTPSTEEVWQHVFGEWGAYMLVDYYRK